MLLHNIFFEKSLIFTSWVLNLVVYRGRKEKISNFLYDIHLKGYIELVVYCVEGTSPSIYFIYTKKVYGVHLI